MPQANGLQFTAHVGELPSDLFSVVGFTLTERLCELVHGRLELASTNADVDAFSVLEQSVVLVVWQDGAPLHWCGQRVCSGRQRPPPYPLRIDHSAAFVALRADAQ